MILKSFKQTSGRVRSQIVCVCFQKVWRISSCEEAKIRAQEIIGTLNNVEAVK